MKAKASISNLQRWLGEHGAAHPRSIPLPQARGQFVQASRGTPGVLAAPPSPTFLVARAAGCVIHRHSRSHTHTESSFSGNWCGFQPQFTGGGLAMPHPYLGSGGPKPQEAVSCCPLPTAPITLTSGGIQACSAPHPLSWLACLHQGFPSDWTERRTPSPPSWLHSQ